MKRKIFFIGALATFLSVTTPVMAFNCGSIVNNSQKQSTDKEDKILQEIIEIKNMLKANK